MVKLYVNVDQLMCFFRFFALQTFKIEGGKAHFHKSSTSSTSVILTFMCKVCMFCIQPVSNFNLVSFKMIIFQPFGFFTTFGQTDVRISL